MAKILIIDDDVDIVETTAFHLQKAGYETASAGNRKDGEKAVELEKPDLILLDVMMAEPDDGFTLAQDLRRKGLKTPIVMLTSVSRALGMDFGKDSDIVPVDEFLEKPVKPAVLLEKIKKHLAR